MANLEGFQAFINWSNTNSTSVFTAENLPKESTSLTLANKLLVKPKSIVIFENHGWLVPTNSELTETLTIEPSLFEIPANSEGLYIPVFPLIGYTKTLLRISKKTRSIAQLNQKGIIEQSRKVSVPYELVFTGFYNTEFNTFESVVIPASESDKEVTLVLTYPFKRLRIIRGSIQNYQESGDLSENVLKVNWTLSARSIDTYVF